MKRIATLLLAIVMLVSVMMPSAVFAASAYTDPDDAITVATYTSADDATVPANETWIQMNINNSTSANGNTLTCETETADTTGIVSFKGAFKITGGSDSRPGLLPPIGSTTDANIYTNGTKGIDGDVLTIYPGKAGLKGAYKIKWWYLYYATSNNMIGFTVKTSSMSEPSTPVELNGAGSPKGRWIYLSDATFNFTGDDDEYIKIYNPTTSSGSVRMTTISFEKSNEAVLEEVPVTIEATSLTTDGAFAEFVPTGLSSSNYNVKFDYVPSASPVTVKYDIYYNADDEGNVEHATEIFNYGDGTYDYAAGSIDLGIYPFTGKTGEKVVVTKVNGAGDVTASKVNFVPTSSEAAAAERLNNAGTIVDFNSDNLDKNNRNNTVWTQDTTETEGYEKYVDYVKP